MCEATQQNFRQPNMHGHVYDGKKTDTGYAMCSACRCVETSIGAAQPCKVTALGRKLTDLLADPQEPPNGEETV